jgi:hypothetical protein
MNLFFSNTFKYNSNKTKQSILVDIKRMIEISINKEIPKVLFNQIYIHFVSHIQKLVPNSKRFRLLGTKPGFSKTLLSKLHMRIIDKVIETTCPTGKIPVKK